MKYVVDLGAAGHGPGVRRTPAIEVLNDHLEAIHAGKHNPYPFYSVLIYTRDRGLDGSLHRYLREKWLDLDALTGPSCLTFAVAAVGLPSQAAANADDVYGLARGLGASADQIPCAVFFERPDVSRRTVVIDFRSFLPERQRYRVNDFLLTFRAFTAATDRLAGERHRNRLRRLPKEIDKARARVFPSAPPRDSSWIQSTLVGGRTVLGTVADLLQVAGTAS